MTTDVQVADSLVSRAFRARAAGARSAVLTWLAFNGVVALPLIVDPHAWFMIFLNPFAPALVVTLEALILLLSLMRFRRLAGLGQDKKPSGI